MQLGSVTEYRYIILDFGCELLKDLRASSIEKLSHYIWFGQY